MMNERFFRLLFLCAALYNIAAGAVTVLFPQLFFHQLGLPEINHPYVMSGLGMFVAVYGYGFYLVSLDPVKNYQFALLGLIGKSFGIIGWWFSTAAEMIPLSAGWTNVLNDIVWIPFFIAFLRWRSKIKG